MYSTVCVVDAVDGLTCEATPVNGGAKVLDIRLTANPEGSKYFAVVPKVGSEVIVTWLSKDLAFVSLVDESEKLVYVNDDVVFEVTDKFLIKKGNDNLFKIMDSLISANKNEVHRTNQGPTIGMVAASKTAFDSVLNRIKDILKDA